MRTLSKAILIGSITAGVALIVWKRKKVSSAAETIVQTVSAAVYDLRDRLPWSNKPSPELVDAMGKASAKYAKVPVLMLVGVSRNESNFRVGTCADPLKAGTFRRERGSWNKHKDEKIKGTDKRWSDYYTAEEWGSYGPFQLLPYNFVPSLVPAGEPLCKGHDPYISAEGAARMLSDAYSKYGNWVNALASYNAGPGGARSSEVIGRYVKHIAQHLTDLGPEARALLPEQIAGLGDLDEVRRLDSYPLYDTTGRIVDWVDIY